MATQAFVHVQMVMEFLIIVDCIRDSAAFQEIIFFKQPNAGFIITHKNGNHNPIMGFGAKIYGLLHQLGSNAMAMIVIVNVIAYLNNLV